MIEEVRGELQKDPLVYASVKAQIEESNKLMKMLGHTDLVAHVNDLVTYIGASDNQKKIVQKLIGKYGAYILEKILVTIYYGEKGDWRNDMK